MSDCQIEIEDLKDQLFTLQERSEAIVLQRDKLFAAYTLEIVILREALVSARAALARIDEPAATGYDTYSACERIDKALEGM